MRAASGTDSLTNPAKASGCALCRSESQKPSGFPPLDRVMVGLLAAIIVMLVGGVLVHVFTPSFERMLGSTAAPAASLEKGASSAAVTDLEAPPPAAPPPDGVHSPVERGPARGELPLTGAGTAGLKSGTFTLRARNVVGRGGSLFIPPEALTGPRPLLVLFHGTGGAGAQILATFSSLARLRGLVVLAPDSGRSPDGAFNWQVPDAPSETTPDVEHVRACLDELYATEHLRIDPERVLAAGHSGGGSSAAYLGTTDVRFRAFAVLHGGVFPRGLGNTRARAWFSTGTEDPLRPPAVVERAAEATRTHTTQLTTRLYPGGHGMSAPELDEMIAWWLDG